jgi:beta-lactamase superfamily II metal-dependent hydrolase
VQKHDSAGFDVNDLMTPPTTKQVEVSIFGPGYGESLVIHIGGGKWVIVDSCIHPELLDTPTPLHYLNQLGVDTANDVILVVATHWHDDHVRGLAKIIETCKSAKFVCSAALLSENFFTIMELYAGSGFSGSSGISEINRVFEILEQSNRSACKAATGRVVYRQRGGKDRFDCEIHALSPSDKAVEHSLKVIAQQISELGLKRKITPLKENEIAVVLWLKIGRDSLILGSDLEEGRFSSWTSIVDDYEGIIEYADLFKVPHHGSITGHNDRIWENMLHPNPCTVTSPFVLGKNRLPTKTDVDRIISFATESYITAKPTLKGNCRERPLKDVNRTIKGYMRDLREVPFAMGQVRIRTVPQTENNKSIELFNGAVPLSSAWE